MVRRLAMLAAAITSLSACLVDIDYSGTSFRCSTGSDCPGAQLCHQGFCVESIPIDAAPADGPDDPVDAAALAGPVLRWTFNEPGGDAVLDESGNGRDGVLQNAARVPGLDGGAIQFDDALDQVVLAAAPEALKPTGAVAVAAWIQVGSIEDGEVVSLGDSYAIRAVDGDDARIFVYDGIDWFGATTVGGGLSDGDWHHVAGQFTGTSLEIYIDGVLGDTVDHTAPVDYSLGLDLVAGKHGDASAGFDFVGLRSSGESKIENRKSKVENRSRLV
jgi:hypothetical protein